MRWSRHRSLAGEVRVRWDEGSVTSDVTMLRTHAATESQRMIERSAVRTLHFLSPARPGYRALHASSRMIVSAASCGSMSEVRTVQPSSSREASLSSFALPTTVTSADPHVMSTP